MAQRYMNAEDAIYACDDFDVDLKGKKRWDELEIIHPEKRQKETRASDTKGCDNGRTPLEG